MNPKTSRIAQRVAVAAAAFCVVLPTATASAGRLVATGHDADHHCGRVTTAPKDGPPHAQCHFVEVAVDYVRAGAPDPTKPVLVLDRGKLDVVASLDRIYGPGVVPRRVMSPRSTTFKNAPITTDRYSAIVIASSKGNPNDPTPQDLNELKSTPDSDAINARAKDIEAFFNTGGGIYVNSGSAHGDGPDDPYYGFLPITVQSAAVTSPYTLTEAGRALGFTRADVVCCPTHNTFEPPSSTSALKAIDTDVNGKLVSVFAETPRFTSLGDPPITPSIEREVGQDLKPNGTCARRRALTLRIRRPENLRFSRAVVYVNNRPVKRLRGRKITRPIKVSLRHARYDNVKTFRVRIKVTTTGKRKINIRRSYRACV